MPRSFCIHAHFYQPPREDPHTGIIPIEPSAQPFSNWNEQIYAHCYHPNADIHNFRKISLDIGPTLFRWLEKNKPETYQQILDQERENYQIYQASNAMAQPYYHIILPLASRQDKLTQILWGIHDYQRRFGHAPDGMWLPECAVDYETLEILAECDLRFTILTSWQAHAEPLDITHPYWVELPSGNDIVAFFYEGYLSGLISFDPPSTRNADDFVTQRLLPTYPPDDQKESLIMLASDGELYGHHARFRDQFLSHLLDGTANANGLKVIFPGVWIDEFPIENSISINPNTSWSCHHGIQRWRSICPCSPEAAWKEPLRHALDQLAASIDQVYLDITQAYFKDPWRLRNEYISVLLGEMQTDELIRSQTKNIDSEEIRKIEKLLAAEDNRMKMFTSDAWFFDQFDRIEPRNAVHFATYACWLVKQATGIDLTPTAIADLSLVKSTTNGLSGEQVFREYWNWLFTNIPQV